MTPLRLQMIEEMKSAGLASATQTVYIDAVRRLAAHYRRSPDRRSEAEVRGYLLELRERGVALGTFKAYHGGIQFLCRQTLDRDWALFQKKEFARYVFRVAVTNTRIVALDDQAVTIRHKHRKSNRWRMSRIPGQEFMRRFLQHVLPKGLHKVRYFGLWHPAKRKEAARARLLLLLDRRTTQPRGQIGADAADPSADPKTSDDPRVCPCCRKGLLLFVRQLSPKRAQGP